MPPQDKGTITVTDDDLVPASPPVSTPPSVMPSAGPGWWDRVSKGMVSPDTFIKWATGGHVTKVSDLEKESDVTPRSKEAPGEAYSRVFHSGFQADLAKTASSLTSPVAITTGAISQAAKLPGLAGKTARAILAMQGLGYGAAGGVEAMEGVQKGASTPEGMQKILSGSSQVVGAAPAVAEVGRIGRGALEKIAPQLFAKGEGAFVAALAPSKRDTPKLREAYQNRAGDLKSAPVQDLGDLYTYAEIKRVEAAQELNRELGRINPHATIIDHYAVADAIRSRVTRSISLASPQEAKVMLDYAERVKQDFFNNPVDLAKAESLVQELNSRSAAFDRMPEAQQKTRLAMGDPILAEKALKIALQDQIEAKLTNYRDLKGRYGDWKEIQNQTQARIDDLERKGGKASYVQRRALESLLSATGLIAGAFHGGGGEGLIAGGGGYLLGRFGADQLLTRLEAPEHALQRGLRPAAPQRPLPFAGMIAQPVAAVQGGGEDTDKILDQMFGAKR
jgi:hypothetical protein